MKKNLATVLAFGILAGAASVFAQSGNYMPTNIASTPSALQAHQVQGEYFGILSNGDTLGAWVVAKGSNSYAVSILPGGLVAIPGQPGGKWGWVTKYTGTDYNRVLNGTTALGVPYALNRIVRKSPTLGLKPRASWSAHPSLGNAISWFDSAAAAASSATEVTGKWNNNGTNPALAYGGYLYRGVKTKATHGAGILHVEMMGAFMPTATGQNRSNSGVYLHGKYEAQVLDSYGLAGAWDEMGGIYKVSIPKTNAALPPMGFQTYDIYFNPRTAGAAGAAAGAAVMTVYLNGVLVQDSVPVPVTTEAGETSSQLSASVLALQAHGTEVVYNNVWFIPVEGAAIGHRELVNALPFDSLLAANGVVSIARTPGARQGLRDISIIDGRFDLKGRRLGEKLAPQVILPGIKR